MTLPDITTLAIAEPTMVAAYVIFGMVGFGSSLFSTPILAHILPLSTVVPTLALTDFIAAIGNGFKLGADLVRVELYRLLLPMFAGSALGAYILFAVPAKVLMLMLGIFIVGYAVYGLVPKHPKPPLAPRWAMFFGFAGGILTALFGAGGWVYSMYLVRRLDDPKQIRATQTAVLSVSSCIRVGLFTVAGRYFDLTLLVFVACLLPAVGLGLFISHHVTTRLDRKRFLQVLFTVLFCTGGSLIVRGLWPGA